MYIILKSMTHKTKVRDFCSLAAAWRYTNYSCIYFALLQPRLLTFCATSITHGSCFLITHVATPIMSVGVGRIFDFFCLFVCLSVCPQHNSKTNDPKVFKLCIGNDLGMYCTWYGFGLKGQRSTLGFGLTAILRGFELYECLLVWRILLRVLKPRLYLATCCRAAYFESVHWICYSMANALLSSNHRSPYIMTRC